MCSWRLCAQQEHVVGDLNIGLGELSGSGEGDIGRWRPWPYRRRDLGDAVHDRPLEGVRVHESRERGDE